MMPRFYCPFCSPHYQIYKKRAGGQMLCGQCGEPLVKIPVVKPTQIFALIAASAFIAPLLITAFAFIQDLNKPQPRRSTQLIKIDFEERV